VEFGYKLSSEEHDPSSLVRYAAQAEDSGFEFAMISDHFHPWIDQQGHSPLVWAVLGGVAQATRQLRVGTAVTCPTIRIHPAIIAQAAATVACMMPGRFMLGLGSGENLNEHITGQKWPEPPIRLEMLREAIDIIHTLWEGGMRSYYGEYFTVENARIYTMPDQLPPILVAASGSMAARVAGECGDGFIGTSPDKELLKEADEASGVALPKYAEVAVCWAESQQAGLDTAMKWWPNTGVPGDLSYELPLPSHFEQAAQTVRPEDLASIVCGPDPEPFVAATKKYVEAGYDHIWFHQIGPDQEGFFRFFEHDLAALSSLKAKPGAPAKNGRKRVAAVSGSGP
jgi:G6PDH family F420-dependent oxidoreductase